MDTIGRRRLPRRRRRRRRGPGGAPQQFWFRCAERRSGSRRESAPAATEQVPSGTARSLRLVTLDGQVSSRSLRSESGRNGSTRGIGVPIRDNRSSGTAGRRDRAVAQGVVWSDVRSWMKGADGTRSGRGDHGMRWGVVRWRALCAMDCRQEHVRGQVSGHVRVGDPTRDEALHNPKWVS